MNPTLECTTTPADSRAAFAALDHAHQQLIAAEIAELVAIAHTIDLYRVDQATVQEGMERILRPGRDGTPPVGEFLALEIGALLGVSPSTAIGRIADTLDLRHRLPALWDAVLTGRVRVWQAGRIIAATSDLDAEAVATVNARLLSWLPRMDWQRIMKALPAWVAAADPVLAAEQTAAWANSRRVSVSDITNGHVTMWGLLNPADGIAFDHALTEIAKTLPDTNHPDAGADLDARRAAAVGVLAKQALGQDQLPTHTLVIHVNAADPVITGGGPAGVSVVPAEGPTCPPAGIAVIERWGQLLTTRLPEFLAASRVVVRPIIDPTTVGPVDQYQIPDRMRFTICQRNPVDVFPYGTRPARTCDLDHTTPYTPGIPGQTSLDNLGPLSRFTHRGKTHAGWKLTQPAPGHYRWTSPNGYQYQVTPTGTTRINPPPPTR